jgi:serine/threonine-protein kinase HipA
VKESAKPATPGERWDPLLREAAGLVMADAARMDCLVSDTRAAFACSEWLASHA